MFKNQEYRRGLGVMVMVFNGTFQQYFDLLFAMWLQLKFERILITIKQQ
jgi:hypothetical protein